MLRHLRNRLRFARLQWQLGGETLLRLSQAAEAAGLPCDGRTPLGFRYTLTLTIEPEP